MGATAEPVSVAAHRSLGMTFVDSAGVIATHHNAMWLNLPSFRFSGGPAC